jgi:uncharacterized membrane protein
VKNKKANYKGMTEAKVKSKSCLYDLLPCANRVSVGVIVFNATFNNMSFLSWQSVLLMEETGVTGNFLNFSFIALGQHLAEVAVATESK